MISEKAILDALSICQSILKAAERRLNRGFDAKNAQNALDRVEFVRTHLEWVEVDLRSLVTAQSDLKAAQNDPKTTE